MWSQFGQVFQDTGNFVRNRPVFIFYAVVMFVLPQLLLSTFFPKIPLDFAQLNASSEKGMELVGQSLLPSILSMLIHVFVNMLVILNIQSISQGQVSTFWRNGLPALNRFAGVLLLSFLQALALSFAVTATLFGGNSFSLLTLPLLISGLFIFIKLSLVVYVYLLERPHFSVGQSLMFVWQMSRGKFLQLVVFCVIIDVLPLFLNGGIASVQVPLLSEMLGALVNVLVIIFSFRFYQIYRQ